MPSEGRVQPGFGIGPVACRLDARTPCRSRRSAGWIVLELTSPLADLDAPASGPGQAYSVPNGKDVDTAPPCHSPTDTIVLPRSPSRPSRTKLGELFTGPLDVPHIHEASGGLVYVSGICAPGSVNGRLPLGGKSEEGVMATAAASQVSPWGLRAGCDGACGNLSCIQSDGEGTSQPLVFERMGR